jgi:hypothetical protein
MALPCFPASLHPAIRCARFLFYLRGVRTCVDFVFAKVSWVLSY